MEALLSAFLAAALAELGDKTQWLALALAVHFRRVAPVLAGIALAALVNSAIAAGAGGYMSPMLTREAKTLLLALALLFAGAAGFARRGPGGFDNWRLGAFGTSFIAFLIAELGDKTQFLTFAIAARAANPALAGIGATAGILAMAALAAIGGRAALDALPLAWLRRGIGVLFLVLGFVAAISALGLI